MASSQQRCDQATDQEGLKVCPGGLVNHTTNLFTAGNIRHKFDQWCKITSDKNILDIVSEGYSIEFIDGIAPVQYVAPFQPVYSRHENMAIDIEISKLLSARVLEKAQFHNRQFVSTIFTRPKLDGSVRLILNLKHLNKFVEYHHFKMDTFSTALPLINHESYLASVDLTQAYYSVNVHHSDRKFLRFCWNNQLYQFTCLPNGLASAPRIFTKLLKPVFATLRTFGHTNVAYIDDSLLISNCLDSCLDNVKDTVGLFQDLGFTINHKKSVLTPSHSVTFLGFIIDSAKMLVYLPEKKQQCILDICSNLLHKSRCKLQDLASVIGSLISVFPATEFGQMHYRKLEMAKILGLKESFGNFNAFIELTNSMKLQLLWWTQNVQQQSKQINRGNAQLILTCDASLAGWGSYIGDEIAAGIWSQAETCYHINSLELLAILYGLQSLCKDIYDKHILIRSDNTSAIAYINNMGGIRSARCDDIACNIWNWAIQHKIWLSATHLPGVLNVKADKLSRNYDRSKEWKLNEEIFKTLVDIWPSPQIDLFASRLNNQLDTYISWLPDPHAISINAFSHDWGNNYCYIFPPFSIIAKCLQKIQTDVAEALIVVPLWPTQTWFNKLMELLIDIPRILPLRKDLLTLPGVTKTHPLFPKLILMACRLSGNLSKIKTFQQGLPSSYLIPGDTQQKCNTKSILRNGFYSVVQGKLIQFR